MPNKKKINNFLYDNLYFEPTNESKPVGRVDVHESCNNGYTIGLYNVQFSFKSHKFINIEHLDELKKQLIERYRRDHEKILLTNIVNSKNILYIQEIYINDYKNANMDTLVTNYKINSITGEYEAILQPKNLDTEYIFSIFMFFYKKEKRGDIIKKYLHCFADAKIAKEKFKFMSKILKPYFERAING